MNADPESVLQINAVETDGEFLPVPERNLKIEFIGDSITSGEGDIGAKAETDWISMFFSAENNYAVMVSRALNADIRVSSQSGWGVCCGWNNDPNSAIPPIYGQLCGLLSGEKTLPSAQKSRMISQNGSRITSSSTSVQTTAARFHSLPGQMKQPARRFRTAVRKTVS